MRKLKKRNIRLGVQSIFFLLIAFISVNKTLTELGRGIGVLSDASLHALCPFGGVVTLYQWVTLGTFIQKIHSSSLILMAIILLLSILLGPVFCGWVCPFGSYQEWVGKVGRRLFRHKYNRFIYGTLDQVLRYFRYGVLIWVVYVTAHSGYLIFDTVDPYKALFTFWSEEVSVTALIILGIITVISLVVERPWCKYACPYGALLGFSNKIRIFQIRRSQNTCVGCEQCDHKCPMNINISKKESVSDLSCIRCMECTSERSCPVEDTVYLKGRSVGGWRNIKSKMVGIVIFLVIFGGIGCTILFGMWATKSDKQPVKYAAGEFSGKYNPADIRGSYTFEEVSELFDIELNILYEAFQIPQGTDAAIFKSKDLESLYADSEYEIGKQSVRNFVALYKNLPIDLKESYLTKQAAELIYEENKELTKEQLEYLEHFTVQ